MISQELQTSFPYTIGNYVSLTAKSPPLGSGSDSETWENLLWYFGTLLELKVTTDFSCKMDELTSRRIKVCCMNLHACIQIWEEHNARGFDVASNLVNSSLKHHQSCTTPMSHEKGESSYHAELQDVLEAMEATVKHITSLSSNLKSIIELVEGRGEDTAAAIFQTLPIIRFASCADAMVRDYSQELSLRRQIAGDLFQGQSNRDTCTLYLSCWLHQPYLEKETKDQLEALLIDTGLRTSRT